MAGRDQLSGGCWLGVNKSAIVAGLTNNREVPFNSSPEVSRGGITLEALSTDDESLFKQDLIQNKQRYSNFNFLMIDARDYPKAWYFGSADVVHPMGELVESASFSLANGTIHSKWPKMCLGLDLVMEAAFKSSGEKQFIEMMFDVLTNTDQHLTSIPSNTTLSEESEIVASSIFIPFCEIEYKAPSRHLKGCHGVYGTVSSLIMLVDDVGVTCYEVSWRNFQFPDGKRSNYECKEAVVEHINRNLVKNYISFGD